MAYSDYGLDNNKRSKDPNTVIKTKWCLWCNSETQAPAFNLCFSNFVICAPCVETALHTRERWENTTEECFKCNSKVPILGYRTHPDITAYLHLCEKCMRWADEVLIKPEPF